jgi:plasmid maintenance system antidote protein VapI
MMADTIPTPTIGEILEEEFVRPLEITPYRLSKLLGTSERFWINLQVSIDVRNRKPELEKIRPIRVSA